MHAQLQVALSLLQAYCFANIKSMSRCVRIVCSDLNVYVCRELSTGLMQIDNQDFFIHKFYPQVIHKLFQQSLIQPDEANRLEVTA